MNINNIREYIVLSTNFACGREKKLSLKHAGVRIDYPLYSFGKVDPTFK